MSTPQDALVEALAEEFCRRRPQGRVHSLLDGYPCKACTLDAREFIERHRIVSLPEEAPWVYERRCGFCGTYDDGVVDEGEICGVDPHTGEPEHPHCFDYFRIPGNPIEVNTESGDE